MQYTLRDKSEEGNFQENKRTKETNDSRMFEHLKTANHFMTGSQILHSLGGCNLCQTGVLLHGTKLRSHEITRQGTECCQMWQTTEGIKLRKGRTKDS
jgi:hypothetical protein